VRAAILIRAMTPELQARADGYARQARAVSALRREAAAASEQLFTAESLVADRKGELERMIVEKTQLERAYAQEAMTGDEQGTLGALTDGLAPGRAADRSADPDAARPRRRRSALRPGHAGRRPRHGPDDPHRKGSRRGQSRRRNVVEYAGALNGWGAVLILRAQGAYHLVLAGLDQITVVTRTICRTRRDHWPDGGACIFGARTLFRGAGRWRPGRSGALDETRSRGKRLFQR
jgi:septal ring factor EnvC (AmiA/AmiB activator)